MSWEELEPPVSDQVEIDRKKAEETRRLGLFVKVFNTDEGKELLEIFRERTIERPTVPLGCPDGVVMTNLSNIREGENNFYRWIKSQIKRGLENV